jgi:hypothetical protein
MKFRIHAVTPFEYGIYIASVEWSHIELELSKLRMAAPAGWDYFAWVPMALTDTLNNSPIHEQTTKGQTRVRRRKGRSPRECRHQKECDRPADVLRSGAQPPKPEAPAETIRATADRPDLAGEGTATTTD